MKLSIFKSKTACVVLVCAGAVSCTSGCSVVQPREADCGLGHISHPLLGKPFGPENEEDTLDTLGCRLRTEFAENDRLFVETSLARKMGDHGFYGNSRLIFQSYIGFKLWSKDE